MSFIGFSVAIVILSLVASMVYHVGIHEIDHWVMCVFGALWGSTEAQLYRLRREMGEKWWEM